MFFFCVFNIYNWYPLTPISPLYFVVFTPYDKASLLLYEILLLFMFILGGLKPEKTH